MEDEGIGLVLVFFQGANFDMSGGEDTEKGEGARCDTDNGRSGDGEQNKETRIVVTAMGGSHNMSRVGVVAFGRPALCASFIMAYLNPSGALRARNIRNGVVSTIQTGFSIVRGGAIWPQASLGRSLVLCLSTNYGRLSPVRSGSRTGPLPDSRWTRRGFDSSCSRTEFARCP